MDWNKLCEFNSFAKIDSGKSDLNLIIDALFCVYKYNIGFIDYYIFKFYEKEETERSKWMGTGFKYEYDLIMNPKAHREILQNKEIFFSEYSQFINHANCTLSDLEKDNEKFQKVWTNKSGKIVTKDAFGQCGWEVEIIRVTDYDRTSLLDYMNQKGFNLLEEYILQHDNLAELSNTGLNTIRLITQLNPDGKIDFIGPTLRLSVNSHVDNMAVGNLAAPIDLATGKVIGPGQYQDISKLEEFKHPVTGVDIRGFQIPYWKEVLTLCEEAALYNTLNKSIGWDVAITNEGPSFIEGNHNWCKILWQIPRQEGLKSVLIPYLDAAKNGNKVYS